MTLGIMRKFFAIGLWLLCFQSSYAEVGSVHIASILDPNAIIITEVDVVFIYEDEFVDAFPMEKSRWYSNKRGFTQRAGDAIDIVNTFVPQGFDSVTLSLPERRGSALKVFVYGYHDDSKAAPVDITGFANVLIQIDPFGIRVSERGE